MKLISDTKLQEKINWHPIENQIPIIQSVSDNRETVLCAGRRFGKSALCAYLAVRELLKDNKHIWIVSPTYNLSEKVFAYVKQFIALGFPSVASGISSRPYPRVITPWGSWIECKSGDEPNSLLGEELDLLIVDEASRIKKDVYERYLFPTTSSRQGKIIFISTPFGKNWFYERWIHNKEKNASFQFSSLQGASISQEEWENAKITLPQAVFEQEYLATFMDSASSVFRGVKDVVCDCLAEPKRGHRYIMGLDLAKMNDFTVITIVDRMTHEVVYHDRFQKISYPLQRDRIRNAAIKYNRCKIVIDALNIGSQMGDELRNEGIIVEDFKATGTIFVGDGDTRFKGTKERIIDKLSAWIEDKNIKIPSIPVLIDELEGFGYEITDSGRMTYCAPTGGHDDCFVKGTFVKTIFGNKPIEEIRVGDLVLTRDGYRPVVHTRKRPKKVISNIGLRGTPTHPVILADGTLKNLQDVCSYDILHIWNTSKQKIEKLSFTGGKNIIGIQTPKGGHCVHTFGNTILGKVLQFHYIDRFGKIILEKYQMVIAYIIKIITNLIMNLPIWSVSLNGNIVNIMQEKRLLEKMQFANINIAENIFHIPTQYEKQDFVPTYAGQDREMVYNLQVLGKNEYFANNVLVHNCVMSLALAVWKIEGKAKKQDIEIQRSIPKKTKKFQYN